MEMEMEMENKNKNKKKKYVKIGITVFVVWFFAQFAYNYSEETKKDEARIALNKARREAAERLLKDGSYDVEKHRKELFKNL